MVAFMSQTFQAGEKHYFLLEKKATAIIEAVRKWENFLARRHFVLVTDQNPLPSCKITASVQKLKTIKSSVGGLSLHLCHTPFSVAPVMKIWVLTH